MFKLYIKRVMDVRAPFDLYMNAAVDWTHFVHIHRKTHQTYKLLFKSGDREIFLYRARRLYPLPFFDTYVVFRKYMPEQNCYRNVYLNVATGQANYLDGTITPKGDPKGERLISTGEFVFTLPDYWRPFTRLFFWIFKRRMQRVTREDNDWIRERIAVGGFESPACAPPIPEVYDLFDDLFANGLPRGDVSYTDSGQDDLMPPGPS